MVFAAVIVLLAGAVSYAQYAPIDGKWVVVNGPASYESLGVCLDEKSLERLLIILQRGDKQDFEQALESFRILRVKNHFHAVVLQENVYEGTARVLILDGLHRGFSGWIPLGWLRDNHRRPAFSTI